MDAMLYVSTDGGAVWTAKDCHCGEGGCVLVHPERANLVLAGGKGRTSGYPMVVSYSTDAGNTWTRCQLSGINSGSVRTLAVAPSQLGTIYAAGEINGSGSVHVSTDYGVSWTETMTAPADMVTGLAVHPEHPDWIYGATLDGLFRTTDGGATWQNLGAGSGLTSVRFFPGSSDTLFAGGNGGVVMSADGGEHWIPFNQGLGSATVNCLEFAVSGEVRLYAGTEGEACYVYAFPTGVVEPQTKLKDASTEPNPTIARGVLNLQSTISNLQSEIVLLDITGRKVMNLVSGENNIHHLAPGVYFVQQKDKKYTTKVIIQR